MALTKREFKFKWEVLDGDGITFDDIAECAVQWGLFANPRIHNIYKVANRVLEAAKCEKYFNENN